MDESAGRSSYGFYEVDEKTAHLIEKFPTYCIDEDEDELLNVFGDYNTDRAANLMVVFDICKEDALTGRKCKS